MKREPSPAMTAELLRHFFTYEPEVGVFKWRIQRWRRKPGDTAGLLDTRGHVQLSINGRLYLAHRMAWLYHFGEQPPAILDHINGIKTDNRIANLRPATVQMNCQNWHKAPVTNVNSRLLGVSRVTGGAENQWQARITANGKQHYLGCFKTADEAHQAYLEAKRSLHVGCTI